MGRVFISTAGQGGVGATTNLIMLARYLKDLGDLVYIVNADPEEDLKDLATTQFDGFMLNQLRDRDDWFRLLRATTDRPHHNVLINLPASRLSDFIAYGTSLTKAMTRLQRFVIVLFAAGTDRRSTAQLAALLGGPQGSRIHVLYHTASQSGRQVLKSFSSKIMAELKERYGGTHRCPKMSLQNLASIRIPAGSGASRRRLLHDFTLRMATKAYDRVFRDIEVSTRNSIAICTLANNQICN